MAPSQDHPSDHLTIHLLITNPAVHASFRDSKPPADSPLWSHFTIHKHDCSLAMLAPHHKFDAVVSPANSYGRMDGGFDNAISRAMAPRGDYLAVTRVVQKVLRRECRGYLPPGGCLIADLPPEWEPPEDGQPVEDGGLRSRNVWGCSRVLICPTMSAPMDIQWDREVVYESVWSMLAAVEAHNRRCMEEDDKIRTVAMAPAGTGAGRLSGGKWAAQMVMAMRHWVSEGEKGEEEGTEWVDVERRCEELKTTWDL